MTRRRLLVILLAGTAYGCTAKESDFFAPQPIEGNLLPDIDAPVFSAVKPVSGATVLNSNILSFTVNDPVGAGGAVPSGIDEATVTATVGSGAITLLNATASNYSGSFASLNDGAVSLTLSAKDRVGNTRTSILNFNLDRTAPLIVFTESPALETSSSEDSVLISTVGTVAEPNFA